MQFLLVLLSAFIIASNSTCATLPADGRPSVKEMAKLDGLHKAYFASGCFWCVEAVFESVMGVEEAVSGYCGGHTKNPTYQTIGTGTTGHAEAVEIYYDTTKIDYPTLLKVFFGSHDPTTLNRQGPDEGTQYRSGIYYTNENEKEIVEAYIKDLEEKGEFSGTITTEVAELDIFYKAEEYHQDYEKKNPNQPYVRAVSIPRLKKFQSAFPELLKKAH